MNPYAAFLLFVGRLVYYKGVSVLLDAFSQVRGAELNIVEAAAGKTAQGPGRFTRITGKIHFWGTQ